MAVVFLVRLLDEETETQIMRRRRFQGPPRERGKKKERQLLFRRKQEAPNTTISIIL